MKAKPIIVQKFGGTSVATAESRMQVVKQVRRAQSEGYRVAVVVSAMGREGDPYATDTLINLLRAGGGWVDRRDYDLIYCCGELISTAVMSHLLKQEGIPSVGLSGEQAHIFTDDNHGEAEILEIEPQRLLSHLEREEVPVLAGCQGVVRESGNYSTLGRGGSDTSAVAVGAVLRADLVEIYTDVQGIAVTDPRIVPQAPFLKKISFERAFEMASYGAGVVHPRAVRTGWKENIPIRVRSTYSMSPGTLITDTKDEHPVVGIAILAAMETIALAKNALDHRTREDWERKRLIKSLTDSKTGNLILGIKSADSNELMEAVEKRGLALKQRLGDLCWISLVGETEALERRMSDDLVLLSREGIEVTGNEASATRNTYIISAENRTKAVEILYRSIFA